jgi:hypothetical protein
MKQTGTKTETERCKRAHYPVNRLLHLSQIQQSIEPVSGGSLDTAGF